MDRNGYNASWWNKEHESAWDKVKEAFRRDWVQTKHDLGGRSPDLDQGVSDTVKQAAGKEAIPPGNQPNFEEYEPAFRFGYGARQHYGKQFPAWDDRLEATLRQDWSAGSDDVTWKRYVSGIRRGYEYTG